MYVCRGATCPVDATRAGQAVVFGRHSASCQKIRAASADSPAPAANKTIVHGADSNLKIVSWVKVTKLKRDQVTKTTAYVDLEHTSDNPQMRHTYVCMYVRIDGGFEEDEEVEPGDVGEESAERAAGATETESMYVCNRGVDRYTQEDQEVCNGTLCRQTDASC